MASTIYAVEQVNPAAKHWPAISGRSYDGLFAAIGRGTFQHELLMLFDDVCGADSVHLFWLKEGRPDIASGLSLVGQGVAQSQAQHYMKGGFWRGDRQMGEGSTLQCEQARFYRMETREAPTSDLRDFYRRQKLIERLMVCGWTPMGVVGLSILRSEVRGLMPVDSQQQISRVLSDIFPYISKHMEIVGQNRFLGDALTILPLIEEYLEQNDVGLSHREMQVAARLLYGLNASCIASDLGIGAETVNTHRKRLYQRLGIGCHHELLVWYLNQYGRTNQNFAMSCLAAS